jgi:hypothetical protein
MNKDQRAFLNVREYEKFHKEGYFEPRTIVEIPLGPSAKPIDLVEYVKRRFSSRASSLGRWFECICIQVRNGDGRSWSAEKLYEAIGESYATFYRFPLAPNQTTDSLPAITTCLGTRRLLKLAVKLQLTTSFITLRWWMAPSIIAAAIILGAMSRIGDALLKAQTDGSHVSGMLSDPLVYVTSAALAVILLLLQSLATFLTTGQKSKSVENFIKGLKEKQTSDQFQKFVESLAVLLGSSASEFPRLVIVDNYELLDDTTRAVIKRYFENPIEEALGSEFWIIFERPDGLKFSNLVVARNFDSQVINGIGLYEQTLINDEQKRRLIRARHRPETAAAFTTVRRICEELVDTAEISPYSKGQNDPRQMFKDYRRGHPRSSDGYDILDLLYLLSLTAATDGHNLSHEQIVSEFTGKSGLLAGILEEFLNAGELKKPKLRESLSQLRDAFTPMGVFKSDDNLEVTLEAAEALSKDAEALELPEAAVGHLFWLLWHRSHQEQNRNSTDASLTRKLAYHSLRIDTSRISDNPAGLLEHLLNTMLMVIENCLKTCIFRDTSETEQSSLIPDLLEKTAALVQIDSANVPSSYRQRLRRKCWETYWILDSARALGVILDLSDGPEAESAIPHQTVDSSHFLQELFFGASPPLAGQMSALHGVALRSFGGRAEAGETIADYAIARATWLTLTIGPLLCRLGVSNFLRALIESQASLDALLDRVSARISAEAFVQAEILDVMTFATAIWSAALRCNPAMIQPIIQGAGASAAALEAMWTQLARERTQMIQDAFDPKRFQRVVDMAELAVLIAGHLRRGRTQIAALRGSINFPMEGLAQELCCIAAASIVLGYRGAMRSVFFSRLDDSVVKDVAAIFVEINNILGTDLPTVKTEEDLVSSVLRDEIDNLMRACSIMWYTFEINQFRDLMEIRKAQFASIESNSERNLHAQYRRFVESLACLNDQGFVGLLSNFATARNLQQVEELSAYYVSQAAETALSGEFGVEVKRELALLAITRCHSYGFDLSGMLSCILEDHTSGTATLRRFLSGLAPEELVSQTLFLLQASRASGHPKLIQACSVAIEDSLRESDLSSDAGREAKSLLDVVALKDRLQKEDGIDSSQLVSEWQTRQDLWTYPWALQEILQRDPNNRLLREACANTLMRNAADDNYNTYFHLALAVASQCVNKQIVDSQGEVAAKYLLGSIEKWQASLSADTNVKVFAVLEFFDSANHAAHAVRKAEWDLLVKEREHLRLLPRLLEEGRFFMVFAKYCESMAGWGLDFDRTPNLNLDRNERQRIISQWRMDGAKVPTAWIQSKGERVISSEFICLGYWIFSPPNNKNSELDRERSFFDKVAQAALPELLDAVVKLPRLPTAIHDLVARYVDRFKTMTYRERIAA